LAGLAADLSEKEGVVSGLRPFRTLYLRHCEPAGWSNPGRFALALDCRVGFASSQWRI